MSIKFLAIISLFHLFVNNKMFGQQVIDSLFTIEMDEPTYKSNEAPLICLDEGHNNGSLLNTSFQPTANILVKDGYRVKSNKGQISGETLKGVDVLVIIDALAKQNIDNWKLPTPSAFGDEEIKLILEWVKKGGSLLFVADHMPFAGASQKLAEAFGVHFNNGFAIDTIGWDITKFSRNDKSLKLHPIIEGRNMNEQVNEISTYFGQGFTTLQNNLMPIMVFNKDNLVIHQPEVAWRFNNETKTISAKGFSQGVVGKVGKGRVVILGDSSLILAHLVGKNKRAIGINSKETKDNFQFTLNLFHWLSHLF